MNRAASEGVGKHGDEPGGTPATSEKEILQDLFYNEEEYLGHLRETVQRALRFFKIEPQTGRVVLGDDARRRRVPDQVRLLLAGRYFAWKYGAITTDKMSYKEIATELNRPASGVSSELTDLVRDGDVSRDEGGLYSMPFHRIDGTLRELETAKPQTNGDGEGAEAVRKAVSRRITRQRADPVLQAMLEKPADLSAYAWVPKLPTAMEKGLAALQIANDVYDQGDLTCTQMATLLSRKFPLAVTRAAINMGLLRVRSQYVTPISRGNEVAYSLLPLGRDYLTKTVDAIRNQTAEKTAPPK